MSLFDRNFLISTGVTAVICGAIYYYLNAKIRELEHALVKQNQVLSSFIANVQQEFRAMASANGVGANGVGANGRGANGMTFEIVTGSNELASPEALAAVAELDNRKIVITGSVCDSSSEDDSEAGDSDSESDNEEETEETEEHDNNKLIICDLPVNDMKIIDMSSLGISHLEIYTPEKQSEDEADAGASEADTSASEVEESDSEEDGFHRVTKLVIGDVNLNVSDLLNTTNKIEEIQVEELLTPVEAPALVPVHVEALALVPVDVEAPAPALAPVSKDITNYDDLKVDDLRKLAVEKGLAQKDSVKKLKKPELLALLKTKTV